MPGRVRRGGPLALALLGACGRLGFDPLGGGDGGPRGGGDGGGPRGDGGGSGGGGCPASCGPAGTSDCCASDLVPGNAPGATLAGQPFFRSYDVGTDQRFADRGFPATVSDVRLDRYEVTVGRFRRFVDAGAGTQAHPPAPGAGARARIPGSGWQASWDAELPIDTSSLRAALACDPRFQTWTAAPAGNEARPMNCVSWYEANAFCAWDGGFLPTEAEWNYAAAGGSEQRAYPWSSPPSSLAIDPSRASYYVDTNDSCGGDGVPGCAVTDLVPVGSKPAGDGRWGHADLGGNVMEWVLDDYRAEPYPTATCDDCAYLGTSTPANRCGHYQEQGLVLRVAERTNSSPYIHVPGLGVRCARPP